MRSLDALGSLYADVRDGLLRLGRAGGAILLGSALPFALGSLALSRMASAREARGALYRVADLRGFAVFLGVLAGALALAGLAQLLRPRAPRGGEHPPMPVEDLLRLARATLRPFYVCVRCRRIWGRTECVGRCPQCDSAADCLEVSGEADLTMVEASLTPDPSPPR